MCCEILKSSLSRLWQENVDVWVIWKATFEWFTAPGYPSSNLSHFSLSLLLVTLIFSLLLFGGSYLLLLQIQVWKLQLPQLWTLMRRGVDAQAEDACLPPLRLIWYSSSWIDENRMYKRRELALMSRLETCSLFLCDTTLVWMYSVGNFTICHCWFTN